MIPRLNAALRPLLPLLSSLLLLLLPIRSPALRSTGADGFCRACPRGLHWRCPAAPANRQEATYSWWVPLFDAARVCLSPATATVSQHLTAK